MFDKETMEQHRSMEQNLREQMAEIDGEPLKASTTGGIDLKPSYTPADINQMNYKEISIPGQYPFT